RLTRQLRLHLAARIATERQPSRGHGWLVGRTKAARLQVKSKRDCKGYDVRSERTAIDVTGGKRRGLDGGVRKAPAPRGKTATNYRRGGTARTQETEMDWNSAQANWQQFKCEEFRSEEHTSELQSLRHLVCRLLLEKKKQSIQPITTATAHTTSWLNYGRLTRRLALISCG